MNWTRDDERRLRIVLAVGLGLVLAAAIVAAVCLLAIPGSAAAPSAAADPIHPGAEPPPRPAPDPTLSRTTEVVSVGGPHKPCAESHLPARGLLKTMGGCGIRDPSVILASRPSTVFRVTAYCPCRLCCGPQACGVTASGTRADHPLIAAPKSMPFGTRLYVPGYGWTKVEDRGGAITEGRLDVLFPTHAEARAWGVRNLVVDGGA